MATLGGRISQLEIQVTQQGQRLAAVEAQVHNVDGWLSRLDDRLDSHRHGNSSRRRQAAVGGGVAAAVVTVVELLRFVLGG